MTGPNEETPADVFAAVIATSLARGARTLTQAGIVSAETSPEPPADQGPRAPRPDFSQASGASAGLPAPSPSRMFGQYVTDRLVPPGSSWR